MTPSENPQADILAQPLPRSIEFGLFLVGGLWAISAQLAARVAAERIALRLGLFAEQALLHALFLVMLLLAGFTMVDWIALRGIKSGGKSVRFVNALPERATAGREWATGAAFGWALMLLAVLPMVLARDLLPVFSFSKQACGAALLSLLTLAVLTLAQEVLFRGFLYERLRRAIGSSAATAGMAALYALAATFHPFASPMSFAVTFVLGLLLCIAYLRTHALWLPWGMHFALAATMTIIFGLPLRGSGNFSSIVSTGVFDGGHTWLTGGFYGPEGALATAFAALLLLPVLYSLTRDFAWQYTHEPIVPAGYAVVVQPPAAHTAMEESAAAKPAPLVQILATTSTKASTLPTIEEHLRDASSDTTS